MAVRELRQELDITLSALLKIVGLTQGQYRYHSTEKAVVDKYADIKEKITFLFFKNKRVYGYRRITEELNALKELKDKKLTINKKVVQRLMKELQLFGKSGRQSTWHDSFDQNDPYVAKDRLKRNFNAQAPGEKILTDVTEFKVNGARLFLSPLLDCYNGEIISYSLSTRPNSRMVRVMMERALRNKRINQRAILHSDQGSVYKSHAFRKRLIKNRIRQSMSRVGNCFDNARMESFFGTLKIEMYHGESFEDIHHLKQVIRSYIHWYNTERIQKRYGYLSPVQYHKQSISLAA